MSNPLSVRIPRWAMVPAGLAAVGVVLAIVLWLREPAGAGRPAPESADLLGQQRAPMKVFRFVDPALVLHRTRFRFSFDPPEALSELRRSEGIEAVVAGASSDLERVRRLAAWTRSQFEPGIPDPYPPLDARIILRDIRSGFTGGFCAQYNYVLAQSLMSLGIPARYVTVVDHEVIEVWLRDERRWACADPLHAATYVDEAGRALSVLNLHRRQREGSPILPGPGSLPGTAGEVGRAFGAFSVWLRNDHVSRPINFTDIDRYKVAFIMDGDAEPQPRGLWTDLEEDLYFDPSLP